MSTTLLPGRRTTAVLLVTAAVGTVLETILSPLDGSSTLQDLNAIAAHQGRFEASVVVGLVASLLFLPGFLGLGQAVGDRSARLAAVGGWLLAGSMAGFVAIRLGQAVELATVKTGGDRRDAATAIDHTAANPIGLPILVLFLGGALVGLVLLAIAAWRAGMPKPACVLLACFQPLDFVLPQHPFPLGAVAHLLLLVALARVAVSLWRPPADAVADVVPALA